MSATVNDIRSAIMRTREARENIITQRTTAAIIDVIAQTAKNWLDPHDRYRLQAIEQAPAATGFSPAMVAEAINLTFGALTAEALRELLDRELGNHRVLDELSVRGNIRTRAVGLNRIVHILAGNVPPPGINSICFGLLLKTANLVKSARRDPVFPALFAESLRAVDAQLADCVAVLSWDHKDPALTTAALADTDAIIAYGDDHSIATLRKLVPPAATFLAHGHRLSFAVVAKEAMTAANLPVLAEAAAFDISVYDQQGCLSPHVIYVEERGELGPRRFAAALAQAMAAYQARVPRGPLSVEEAAVLTRTRDAYVFRSAGDKRISVWRSEGTNDWAVIYEDDPSFAPSCLNRIVFVKPTDGFPRILNAVQRFVSQVSTVGLAPMNERTAAFAAELAQAGISRACPLGQMQRPPLSWYHDGHPNLAPLVRWTDLG